MARSDGRLGPNLQKCEIGKVTDHSPMFVVPRGGDTKGEVCGPLSTLASVATSVLKKIAIDHTGLKGTWAWPLSYLDEAAAQRLPPGSRAAGRGVSDGLAGATGAEAHSNAGPSRRGGHRLGAGAHRELTLSRLEDE